MNHMNQNLDWNERTQDLEHGEPAPVRSTRRKKQGFLRRVAALTLSAVLFGAVSAGTFYGVNALLPQEGSSAASVSAASSGAVLTSLASTSYSGTRYGMDVSDIAAAALPSVVSITNISVQEVQSFFNRFGPNGAGQTQLQENTSCGSGIIIANDGTWLYMVTNAHVVEDATTLSVSFVDNAVYEAQLCGTDEEVDLAVIKVAVSDLSSDTLSQIAVITVGDSDALEVGEQVVAIGNALGYPNIVDAIDRRHVVYNENWKDVFSLERDGTAFVFAASEPIRVGTYSMKEDAERNLYDLGLRDFAAWKNDLLEFLSI